MKQPLFIVIYDDGDGLCMPMTWDHDCTGALNCASEKEKPVAFTSRADARKAIRISAKYAALCKEQNGIVNEDFTPKFIKNIRIQQLTIHTA